MITQAFATKIGMQQAWTKSGKRLAVSRLKMQEGVVVGKKTQQKDNYQALQIAFGQKKLKSMSKPLKTIITKSGFSLGRRYIREIKADDETFQQFEVGKVIPFTDVVKVGDIVDVQGRTKGKGFTGVIKRHGFHGGPKTHGQSDRHRAPGSIGSGTTPGRVYKGKKMAGQSGNVLRTVRNLQVIYIDPEEKELWLSGPVPSHLNGMVRLTVQDFQEFEGLQGAVDRKQETAKSETDEEKKKTEQQSSTASESQSKTDEEVKEAAEEPKAEDIKTKKNEKNEKVENKQEEEKE